MDKKQAIELLKNVRRELIDYHGVNNAIAQALYIVIESVEHDDKKIICDYCRYKDDINTPCYDCPADLIGGSKNE